MWILEMHYRDPIKQHSSVLQIDDRCNQNICGNEMWKGKTKRIGQVEWQVYYSNIQGYEWRCHKFITEAKTLYLVYVNCWGIEQQDIANKFDHATE